MWRSAVVEDGSGDFRTCPLEVLPSRDLGSALGHSSKLHHRDGQQRMQEEPNTLEPGIPPSEDLQLPEVGVTKQ